MKYPEPDYDEVAYEPIPGGSSQRRDLENGRVTYYYISHQPLQHPSSRAYGSVDSHAQQQSNRSDAASKPTNSPQPAAGSSHQEPPTYAEAVRGDHKVQTQD